MRPIRILLAEDHTLVRKGLRSLLEAEDGLLVIDEAIDGREAVEKVGQLQPDIVLMDIAMPGLNGLEATRQLQRRYPKVQVIILTMYADEEYIPQLLEAGARGYVVKQAAPEELIAAVRAVYQGEIYLTPSVSRTVVQEYLRQAATMARTGQDLLTPREREVLQLIAEGHPPRQIAQLLCISVKTVEAHRANLMRKLAASSTADLTRHAIRKKLISLD